MVHVLHIISNLHTGGAETALTRLVTTLDPRTHQHTVISMIAGGVNAGRLREAGASVVELGGTRSLRAAGLLPRLLMLARQTRPDLVQGWMYHGNLAAAAVALFGREKPPVVWGVRQSLTHLRDNRPLTQACILCGTLLRKVPVHIVYNAVAAAEDHERFGYPKSKRKVILNGINTEQFRPQEGAKARLLRHLNLPTDVILIGRVARFAPMKDNPTLIATFRKVAKLCSSAHLVLIGPGMDSDNEQLTRLIEPPELRARVHLMEDRLDVDELTAGFDVAVSSSSDSEGFSNALAEAMACAVPVVATEIGEANIIVGDPARVVPPRNPDALARAVASIIERSSSERRSLGMRDRERVVKNFGIEVFGTAFSNLWMETLDSSQRDAANRSLSSHGNPG